MRGILVVIILVLITSMLIRKIGPAKTFAGLKKISLGWTVVMIILIGGLWWIGDGIKSLYQKQKGAAEIYAATPREYLQTSVIFEFSPNIAEVEFSFDTVGAATIHFENKNDGIIIVKTGWVDNPYEGSYDAHEGNLILPEGSKLIFKREAKRKIFITPKSRMLLNNVQSIPVATRIQ